MPPVVPTAGSNHSAIPSALGYYHQGLYALVVLLTAADKASVSIETADDVVLADEVITLHQLKHSLGTPAPVTTKNEGFWNTIEFWCGMPLDGSVKFIFVTCAPIAEGDKLNALTQEASDRKTLTKTLFDEAERVENERKVSKASGTKEKDLPHAKRWPGCKAFLNLTSIDRDKFVSLITITPLSFTAIDVPDRIGILLSPCVLPAIRPQLTEHLIQWWDRQVALSLLKKRSSSIEKIELTSHVQKLIVDFSAASLPDSFSRQKPTSMASAKGTVLEKQIALVKGGESRLNRALLARWRARNQRNEWLQMDLALAAELDDFDERLIEAWGDKFGPMKDDCEGLSDTTCCKKGRALLDWSHEEAHQVISPIRPMWTHAYLVQGSLQQIADARNATDDNLPKVGWHPNYRALLKG